MTRLPGDFILISEPVVENPYLQEANGHFDGQLWQPGTPEECIQRRAIVALALGSNAVAQLAFADFQRWVELDWKEPHATFRMQQRLFGKFGEEGGKELMDEFLPLWPASADWTETEPLPPTDRLIDELGDLLWLGVAGASNGSINLDSAVVREMWERGALINKEHQLKIEEIEAFISQGYRPILGNIPDDDLDDPLRDVDGMEPSLHLLSLAVALRHAGAQQFGHVQDITHLTVYKEVSERLVAPLAANLVLATAYYAQQWGRGSLSTVIEYNIRKLTSRVLTNTLDKTDGVRE